MRKILAFLFLLAINCPGNIINPGTGGGGASVSDTAYDATSWNAVTDTAPSKNAVRDKIESLVAGGLTGVIDITKAPYSATGDGTTDDTAAINAAIAACPTGGTVFIPEASVGYLLDGAGSELLLIDKNINMFGQGRKSIFLLKSTVGSSTDVIRIAIIGASEMQTISGIAILPASGQKGRHGINLDLTDAASYATHFTMENCYILDLNGDSFHLTNPTNVDGLFCSRFVHNLVNRPFSLLRLGDSNVFAANNFNRGGSHAGDTAITLSTVSGALTNTFMDNNCSMKGGFIHAVSGRQLTIAHNQIEQVDASTMADQSAQIALLGSTEVHEACRIYSNNFNSHGNCAYNIYLGTTSRVDVANNNLFNAEGTSGAINISATASGTTLGYYEGGVTNTNSGSGSLRATYAALTGCATTNLESSTEDFTGVWSQTNVTVTGDATTDPLGGSSADRIVETTATGLHGVGKPVTTAQGTYTASIYVKAGQRTKIMLDVSDNTTGDVAYIFDLSGVSSADSGLTNGTMTDVGHSITSVGNGWYRCSVTATTASGTQVALAAYLVTGTNTYSYTGNASNGLYFWGAQLETGSSMSCYDSN